MAKCLIDAEIAEVGFGTGGNSPGKSARPEQMGRKSGKGVEEPSQ